MKHLFSYWQALNSLNLQYIGNGSKFVQQNWCYRTSFYPLDPSIDMIKLVMSNDCLLLLNEEPVKLAFDTMELLQI